MEIPSLDETGSARGEERVDEDLERAPKSQDASVDVRGEPRAVGWARSAAAAAKGDKRTLVDESLRWEPERVVAVDVLLADSGIGLGSTGKRVEGEIERGTEHLVGWEQLVSKKRGDATKRTQDSLLHQDVPYRGRDSDRRRSLKIGEMPPRGINAVVLGAVVRSQVESGVTEREVDGVAREVEGLQRSLEEDCAEVSEMVSNETKHSPTSSPESMVAPVKPRLDDGRNVERMVV